MSFQDHLCGTGHRRHIAVFASRHTPTLSLRDQSSLHAGGDRVRKRARIFELNSNLHCSIVGTCLTMSEMRHVLVKLDVDGARFATDHEIHAQGVLLAARQDTGGKLLNKTLDRKHKTHISRFAKAATGAEVLEIWDSFVRDGDIPGAYWAALTHPAATDEEIRKIFGEVHMLSHLVGAANRADIRRLRELEEENARLSEKVRRQQAHLREAVLSRDRIIAGLQQSLAAATKSCTLQPCCDAPSEENADTLTALTSRLAALTARSNRLRAKADRMAQEREEIKKERDDLAARECDLMKEIEALEARLNAGERPCRDNAPDMQGRCVLYVGGHANQVPQLRSAAERIGASFMHHDGGIDERSGLITAMVGRADLVVFPVDCVSHVAVAAIKKACRQMDKPYRPLRSSGRASFLAALHAASLQPEQSRDALAASANSP
ncbi:MAG: DUF2325 domain-containing protein [Hyphomicrobiaceae bacterium]